ncbi:hypothetical protein Tco_1397851 [Tanacetum coccineum]
MNELVNDGIKLSKLEINTFFINGLPKKWLSLCQSLRNTNHVKDSELASLFGKLKYEKNLIDNIYETKKKKYLVSTTPLSIVFFSTSIIQDFQDSPNDEEDIRSSHEYLNDLEAEYQARALLAKSKRFFKKEVSSDKNEVTKVKALMTLTDEERVSVGKESARNGDWTKISMKKVHTLLQMEDNDDRKSFLDYMSDNSDMSITSSNIPKSSETKDSTLPNHDTGEVPSNESQRNTTDPSVVVFDSLATDYDLADESSVCSTPLLSLKKLDGAEPVSGPKTIKLILKSKSTFKAGTLKGITINEPSLAHAKGKSSSASKTNSAPNGKLKNVNIEDDPPLAIVMKELNELKL